MHHRSGEFRALMSRVNENLQYVFQTARPVLTLTCSGTGAMESAVTNLFSAGDTVIAVNGGKFGARWAALCRTFALNAVEIKKPWGKAITPEELAASLRAHPGAKAVCLTHSETSTGTATDVRALAKVVRENSGALVCVDGISSVGALELRFDAWGLDVCVSASQKGLMVPPGLAFVALGERAEAAMRGSTIAKFYFDLQKALASWRTSETPWTPPVSLITGLDASLEMMRQEGIENVWARHRHLARALRAGMAALEVRLFSESPSDSVTALWMPEGIPWKEFSTTLARQGGITFAGGQEEYAGKIFRIAHLGYYDGLDMVGAVSAIERALSAHQYRFSAGAGVAATQRALLEPEEGREK